MTRLRGPWPAVAVSLLVLTGCAGTSTGSPEAGAAGSAAPVTGMAPILQITHVGGFVSAATNVTRLPLVSVYPDGRVITEGPVPLSYPGPALPNLQVQRLDPAAAQALVDKAVAAGVRNGADLGRPPVADVPATRFTAVTDAGTQTVEVLALGEVSADAGLTAAQRAGRAKLIALRNELTTLTGDAGPATERYAPVALAAVAWPFVAQDDVGNSPAPAVPWPGPALPGEPLGEGLELGCVTVSGADVAPVLAAAREANRNTAWTSGGKQWSVSFRPMLPEETGCEDLKAAR
jgi:hypothetical protein